MLPNRFVTFATADGETFCDKKPVMSPIHRIASTALLTASLGLLAGTAMQAGAQTAPLEVTTDTAAYCQHLSVQVAKRAKTMKSPPPDVIRLSDEGERLCDEGQVRGGIQRLRRAWMIMVNPEQMQSAQ